MFSGIVEALGTVAEIRSEPPGAWLIVRDERIASTTSVADSISVNGCCLTVVEVTRDTVAFPSRSRDAVSYELGRPD